MITLLMSELMFYCMEENFIWSHKHSTYICKLESGAIFQWFLCFCICLSFFWLFCLPVYLFIHMYLCVCISRPRPSQMKLDLILHIFVEKERKPTHLSKNHSIEEQYVQSLSTVCQTLCFQTSSKVVVLSLFPFIIDRQKYFVGLILWKKMAKKL